MTTSAGRLVRVVLAAAASGAAFAATAQVDLYSKQIAAGCGNDDFCSSNPNTRGHMAVFLTKTFGLKLNGP
jgi:hypothetical protein